EVSKNGSFTDFLPGYRNFSVSGTVATVTGATGNTTYFCRVRAYNSSGLSQYSSVVDVLTTPAATTCLDVASVTTGSFVAQWQSGQTDQYVLDVSQTNTFTSFIIQNKAIYNAVTHQVSNLSPNTNYFYRVRVVNDAGESAHSNTESTVTLPVAVAALPASAIGESTITANWETSPTNAYLIDLSTSPTFTTFVVRNLAITNATRHAFTGLLSTTAYYYRVRAMNASGSSVDSNVIKATTLPGTPVNLKAVDIGPFSFNATWSPVPRVTEYRLDVATDLSFSDRLPRYTDRPVTDVALPITDLSPKSRYYFRVKAIGSGGASAYSATVTVTTLQQFTGQNDNSIVTNKITVSGVKILSAVDQLKWDRRIQTVKYFDGLGRLTQAVDSWFAPDKTDLLTPAYYDRFGRECRQYLPVTWNSGGWRKPDLLDANGNFGGVLANYYNDPSDKIPDDSRPFSEMIVEDSPLNRTVAKYGPGNNWYVNAKKMSFEKLSNSTDREKVIAWEINNLGQPIRSTINNDCITGGYYQAGQLLVTSVKDEDGRETREYTTKDGLLILKKVQAVENPILDSARHWAQTVYIYNSVGLLVYVFQPELSRAVVQYNANPTGDQLNQFAFQYRYDYRRRMIEKRIPGSDWVYYVYDKRNRLVLTQDGNQRRAAAPAWTFTKYDALGRPVMTGRFNHPGSRPAVQQLIDDYYTNLSSGTGNFETYIGTSGSQIAGYDNRSFPILTDEADVYSVTYYDKYDAFFAPSTHGYKSDDITGLPQTCQKDVRGHPTAVLVRNLDTNGWFRTVTFYDNKYRPVQIIADHQKGTLRNSNVLDFTGNLLVRKKTYVVNNVTTTIRETFAYDHIGRILSAKHSINGSADVVLFANEYNETGDVVDKNLHSTDNGQSFHQSVDFAYNIRGWLTKINGDIDVIQPGDTRFDYFGIELGYDQIPAGLQGTRAFNGNISSMIWSRGGGTSVPKQSYIYTYDAMNRLLRADHADFDVTLWKTGANAYREMLSYDLNGNIKSLNRKGSAGIDMDDLRYSYTGNQLSDITEQADPMRGFVNGNGTGTDDYSYDSNGNLWKDRNKGLLSNGDIRYNFLNLVDEVIQGTEKLRYIYDATGKKLAQEVYAGATLVKRTDYIGDLVYEGTSAPVLKFIQHAEGRVLPNGYGWEYQYHLKDHLGSVRVTFTSKAPVTATYSANFETGTSGSGQSTFSNYSSVVYDLMDHTDGGSVYQRVQALNGGANGRVGLAKSISVMPGDEITFSAFAKYMNLSPNTNQTSFLTALASAFGVSSASTGEQLRLYNGLSHFAGSVPQGNRPNDDDSQPKAFITVLLFDKDYKLMDAAWDQVTTAAAQTNPYVKQPHELLAVTCKAKEAGYAYVFLSNEHPTYVDVYFDDLILKHSPSQIVSLSDYYPFGLAFNSYSRENSVEQKYLYNGKELQDELSLGLYDYQARQYDPAIGRFRSVDPAADVVRRWSTYSYAADNPIRFIDPDGMLFTDFIDENGNKTHVEDGSNAVFEVKKTDGLDQRKHYEFKEFDESQGGKNEVNVTTVIQEQQKYNLNNEALQQKDDGTTYCNYATQNIMDAVGSATGQNVTITGRGNDMADKLVTDERYEAVDQSTAERIAQNGGLAVMAFRNYEARKDGSVRSGHLATFSVGENIEKGKAVNIGTAAYTGFQPEASSFFKKKDFETVKFYVLRGNANEVCK
ncbi:MAG TPA: DUF6443 domain-containing protein, partial [Chryseosolibacter sp.]|nr:DUF6443 domain-containing protein [Chryseosolibacter sp.]